MNNETTPVYNPDQHAVAGRQLLDLSGATVEVRPDATGHDRFYEVSPDGSLTRISGSTFDHLASEQIQNDTATEARLAEQAELARAREDAIGRMADFLLTPGGANANREETRLATGIGRPEVKSLGFVNVEEIKDAADALNVARKKAEERAALHAEREAAELGYQKGLDAMRVPRDKATKRVAGLSYRAKLLNGGDHALKRNPDLEREINQAARKQAKDEGYDVTHLEPRVLEVPTPTSNTQSETVAAMKAFQAGQAYEQVNTAIASLSDKEWQAKARQAVYAALKDSGVKLTVENRRDVRDGLLEAVQSRANTTYEIPNIAKEAVAALAAKRERPSREIHGFVEPAQAAIPTPIPPVVPKSKPPTKRTKPSAPSGSLYTPPGAAGEDSGTTPETKAQKLGIRAGLAEKPLKGEDSNLVDDEHGVYAVFDGVGGHMGGNVAANKAREAFKDYFSNASDPTTSEEALAQMREAFALAREILPEDGSFGLTTAAVVRVIDVAGIRHIVVGNAGDSRVILRDNGDEAPTDVVEEQGIENTLLNCLGSEESSSSPDEFVVMPFPDGYKLLICTDGITGDYPRQALSPQEFADAFNQDNPTDSADKFLGYSKKYDDKTAIVIFAEQRGSTPASGSGAGSSVIPAAVAPRVARPTTSRTPETSKAGQAPRAPEKVGRIKRAAKAIGALVIGGGKRAYESLVMTATSPEYRKNIPRRNKVLGGIATLGVIGVGSWLAISAARNGGGDVSGLVRPPSGGGAAPGSATTEAAQRAAEAAARKAAEHAQGLQELSATRVNPGEGFIQNIGEWLGARGVKASGSQSEALYDHLRSAFPDGNFFTEANSSYAMPSGNFGIAGEAGQYHWRPEVLAEIARKAHDMGLDTESLEDIKKLVKK